MTGGPKGPHFAKAGSGAGRTTACNSKKVRVSRVLGDEAIEKIIFGRCFHSFHQLWSVALVASFNNKKTCWWVLERGLSSGEPSRAVDVGILKTGALYTARTPRPFQFSAPLGRLHVVVGTQNANAALRASEN